MRERAFLTRAAWILIVSGLLAVVCYAFVDRPLAWFVYDHTWVPPWFLRWPPRLSAGLKYLALAGMAALAAWRWRRPGGRWQTVALAGAVDLVAATALKTVLKWVFGRYWPQSWAEHLPTLIPDGQYGFHPFRWGEAYESFPSGHALVLGSLLTLLWLAHPRGRRWYGGLYAGLCLALVGLNYHFLGDVVAGSAVGTILGAYVARRFALTSEPSNPGRLQPRTGRC